LKKTLLNEAGSFSFIQISFTGLLPNKVADPDLLGGKIKFAPGSFKID